MNKLNQCCLSVASGSFVGIVSGVVVYGVGLPVSRLEVIPKLLPMQSVLLSSPPSVLITLAMLTGGGGLVGGLLAGFFSQGVYSGLQLGLLAGVLVGLSSLFVNGALVNTFVIVFAVVGGAVAGTIAGGIKQLSNGEYYP